jgi:D-amino-acid dehydrogenase
MTLQPNAPVPDVDVIVIGAGIIGVASALYLQRDGLSVAIVDPADPGEKCSYGNSGSFGVGVIAPAGMPGMPWRIPRLLFDPRQPLFVDRAYAHRLLPWFARFVRSCRPERVEAIAAARASLLGNTLAAYQPLFDVANVQSMIRASGMLFVYEHEHSLRNAGDGVRARAQARCRDPRARRRRRARVESDARRPHRSRRVLSRERPHDQSVAAGEGARARGRRARR